MKDYSSSNSKKSLTGPAQRWFVQLDHSRIRTWSNLATSFLSQYKFNTEMAPDRFELQRMQKKGSESFRAYAQRWRELAAQVKPPMVEKEMVGAFLNTLKDPYYSHLIGHTTSSFADLVIVGERVEDGVKSGRLVDIQALQSLLEQSGTSTIPRRVQTKRTETGPKGGEVQVITSAPSRNDHPQKQRIYVQPSTQQPLILSPGQVQQTNQPGIQIPQPQAPTGEGTRPNPSPPKKEQRKFDPDYYHMGSPGHTTDRCFALRHKIQDLREQHLLRFELEKESKPNVIQNPLPPHGNSNSAGPSSNEISSKNRRPVSAYHATWNQSELEN